MHCEGFYCPERDPVPCPKGTFGPSFWATTINSCISCPPHHYGPREGMSSCQPCGPWSQQPLPGQDSCTCQQEGQIFQVRTYCIVYISSQALANCVHVKNNLQTSAQTEAHVSAQWESSYHSHWLINDLFISYSTSPGK